MGKMRYEFHLVSDDAFLEELRDLLNEEQPASYKIIKIDGGYVYVMLAYEETDQ